MCDTEVMKPNVSKLIFLIFQQKKSIIFIKNTDIDNSNTWGRRWGCVPSYKINIRLIGHTAGKLWTQTCQNWQFFSIFRHKSPLFSLRNRDIENPKTSARSWGCLLSYKTITQHFQCSPLKIGSSCLMWPLIFTNSKWPLVGHPESDHSAKCGNSDLDPFSMFDINFRSNETILAKIIHEMCQNWRKWQLLTYFFNGRRLSWNFSKF